MISINRIVIRVLAYFVVYIKIYTLLLCLLIIKYRQPTKRESYSLFILRHVLLFFYVPICNYEKIAKISEGLIGTIMEVTVKKEH